MGSRSWLGALACFAIWLLIHRFSSGWAAPTFLALCLGCLYLWFLVLRVPKLGEELAEAWPQESELIPDPAAKPSSETPAEQGQQTSAASQSAAVPMSDEEASVVQGFKEAAPEAVPEAAPEAEGQNLEEEMLEPRQVDEPEMADGSADLAAQTEEQSEDAEDDMVDAAKAQELRLEGNEHFKAGRLHDAREAYSEALHLSPPAGDPGSEASKDRAVLHCNRAACLQRLERWEDVVKDCSQAIKLDPSYVKALARRSVAHEELQKWHDAFEDLKKAVELDPSLRAKESRRITILEKRAQEQFEKDKDEMLSKLKDLGNTVLGKFGMSTDNFKLEQDPDTGSYSIKFQN